MITVVDDDPSVRKALSRMIHAAGYSAETYESAEAFTASGAAAKSDCVILDVHLPGKSGLELQLELAKAAPTRPIIFITAFDNDQARSQALEAGAVEFLRKPLDSQRLLEAIESALAGSS